MRLIPRNLMKEQMPMNKEKLVERKPFRSFHWWKIVDRASPFYSVERSTKEIDDNQVNIVDSTHLDHILRDTIDVMKKICVRNW